MTLRIAHRGASGYEAENSIAAFRKAAELKVDYIEMDIQLSKDGVPVVRHDKTLNRTTNLKGRISSYEFSELKEKCILSNGERISSLQEVCEALNDVRIPLYIDLKEFGAEEVVLGVLKQYRKTEEFIFGAFHSGVIKHVKEIDSKVTTVLIIEGNLINFEKEINDCLCDIVALGFDAIEGETVQRIQNIGKKVFTWTVNTPEDIAYAKSLGVDGITGNYPDLIG